MRVCHHHRTQNHDSLATAHIAHYQPPRCRARVKICGDRFYSLALSLREGKGQRIHKGFVVAIAHKIGSKMQVFGAQPQDMVQDFSEF